MLTGWLTAEEIVTPYIAATPTNNSTGFAITATLLLLVGVGTLAGALLYHYPPAGLVGCILVGVSGCIFLTISEKEGSEGWSERTASELSEHYGVNVTKDILLQGNVEDRVSKRLPSYLPLFKEAPLERDDEDGSFVVPPPQQELYLLIDGKVLEVMTREGDTFRPYVAEIPSSERDSNIKEESPAIPAQ